jgi:hypothetical protein
VGSLNVPDLKNFRSEWDEGELTGWSCGVCDWRRPLASHVLNISTIGLALTDYLGHRCSCALLKVPDFPADVTAFALS